MAIAPTTPSNPSSSVSPGRTIAVTVNASAQQPDSAAPAMS
jgi:hypothetical protein